MRTNKLRLVAALLLCSAVVGGVALAAPAAHTLDRWVMGTGGGHAETMGLTIDATIGQPTVGEAMVGPQQLLSGFWGPVPATIHDVYLPLVFRGEG